MRQRQPFFRESRWFVIGAVACGLIGLVVTIVVLWAIITVVQFVTR